MNPMNIDLNGKIDGGRAVCSSPSSYNVICKMFNFLLNELKNTHD